MTHDLWEQRLAAALDRHGRMPLDWQTSDCLRMAADAVEAKTGKRPRLPDYTDETSARTALKANGGTLRKVLDKRYRRVPKMLAQRGDIGLAPAEGRGLALVVCMGVWIGKSATGTRIVAASEIRAAWRVV